MRKSIHFILTLTVIILQIGCVQETHLKKITFQVDMSGVDSSSKVGIRGDTAPLSWDETYYFEDIDNDGIYEGALEFDVAQNTIAFKFVNNEDSFELDGANNRTITLEYKPEVIVYSGTFDQLDGSQKSY